MKLKNSLFLFFVWICVSLSAQERIYFNDFESGDLNLNQYTGNPEIADHISSTIWTNDSKSNFSEKEGAGGSKAISITKGEVSIFFDIEIEPGYQLDITGYEFWSKKTKANSGWNLYLEGDDDAVTDGGDTGTEGTVSEGNLEFLNQRGTIRLEFRVNGLGNGFYILDNFELFGQVTKICDDPLITTQPNDINVCSGDQAVFSIETIPGETATYQWQILSNGSWEVLVDDQNYSGVNTSTLVIENTNLTFNQDIYRCITFIDGCEEESSQAELNVIALPETEPIIYSN
ncbi:immunoglobulin domain-containing protein [Psychroflexus salinarum]|uniref:Immunoglobulin domain-containing protein n=1 Tax=Psychroflexus salinarum TaxID=546024 RepID=A0ABW3GQI7_9FLAO